MPYVSDQQLGYKSRVEEAERSTPNTRKSTPSDGHVLPSTSGDVSSARLTGTTARRKAIGIEQIVWDAELAGFGLRLRPSGHRSWIVQYRRRGEQRKVTLGSTSELDAHTAREKARGLLAEAAVQGLPLRPKAGPTALRLAGYVDEFWRDVALHWKPTTQARARHALGKVLLPYFGRKTLSGITRADVLAFRETRSHRGSSFHTELSILSAMLGYAEKLGYRQPGSNPCRGVPRYKQRLRERYLTASDYRRLASVLRANGREMSRSVAIVRLLLFTGARRAEIEGLRWEWLTPNYVRLPDSKTGPKRLYLNRPANAELDRLGRAEQGPVFGKDDQRAQLWREWNVIRRAAAIPDVRLHDLRHSFASIAITSGMPLLTIGRLLGHVLPETTARYAHLADDAIQDAASRISGSIAQALGMRS